MGVMPFMYGMLKGNPKDKQRYIYIRICYPLAFLIWKGNVRKRKDPSSNTCLPVFFLGGRIFSSCKSCSVQRFLCVKASVCKGVCA